MYQGRNSDTSTAESGSDVDDSCSPTRQSSSRFPRLAPVHEEVSSGTFGTQLYDLLNSNMADERKPC